MGHADSEIGDGVGELRPGEHHPVADLAFRWIKNMIKMQFAEVLALQESLATCGLAGNRVAGLCSETLRRVLAGENFSDRHLLALAWFMRNETEVFSEAKEAKTDNVQAV